METDKKHLKYHRILNSKFTWVIFISVTIILISGLLFTKFLFRKAKEETMAWSGKSLDAVSIYIERELYFVQYVAKVLSGSSGIISALSFKEAKTIDAANAVLDRYALEFDGAVCYLMDKKGNVIASSNRNTAESFVGKNYGFRPYFKDASEGKLGELFALGVTSHEKGYYVSYPVQDSNKNILGVVVVKKKLDDIENSLSRFGNFFLVSFDGIIFCSSIPELDLMSLWPLDIGVEKKLLDSKQFGTHHFQEAFTKKIAKGEIISWRNKKFIVNSKLLNGRKDSLFEFASVHRIKIYTMIGVIGTVFMLIIVGIFFIAIYYIRKSVAKIAWSEKRYRELVDSANSIILKINQNGDIVFFNKFAQNFFGYSEEEIIGKNIIGTIVPQIESRTGRHLNSMVAEILSSPEDYANNENENICKDGRRVWISWTNKVVYDDNGMPSGILCIGQDITEQKDIDYLKNEFVSTVSHELRTPLSIVQEGISILLDKIPGDINEKQSDILMTAKDNLNRLAKIIDNLLDISKIEARKVVLEKESIEVSDLIQKVTAVFKHVVEEKGLILKTNYPKKPIKVFIDVDKIIQVFINLVGNALKFTGKGYIEISVKDKESEIECTVADTGCGIAKHNLGKVFDKFQQIGRTPGPGVKGTGLGLSIARGIVQMHGGKIWAESELGKGTKIIFTIPK